jgi:hypothetical protein
MEKVISLLFDIEEKADQIIKRSMDEKSTLQTELEQDIKLLEKFITKEYVLKLNSLKLQIDAELQTDKQNLMESFQLKLSEMESNYKLQHKELAETIFLTIISRSSYVS